MEQVKMAAHALNHALSSIVGLPMRNFEDCYFMPIGTTPSPVPESKNLDLLGLLGLLVFGE